MSYLGDFAAGDTIDFKFTTRRFSTGAPFALGGTPAISVYKSNSTTQSTSGITLTVDFDTVTGLNHVRIDTTSDGTFYADGSQFDVIITTGTVDSISVVGQIVGRFTLRAQASLYPTTAGRKLDVSAGGEAGLDWANIGSPTTTVNLSGTTVKTATDVETDTADIQTRLPAALVSGRIDASVGAMASGVLTATAIAADAITAAKVAADVTTELQSGLATAAALSTVAGYIDTEIAAIISTLGTPAGASVSADIAAVKAETAAILDDTGTSGVVLTATERNAVADAHLDRANAIETGITPRLAHRYSVSAAAGVLSGAATTTVTLKGAGVATDRIVATVDADGNRSAVVLS